MDLLLKAVTLYFNWFKRGNGYREGHKCESRFFAVLTKIPLKAAMIVYKVFANNRDILSIAL